MAGKKMISKPLGLFKGGLGTALWDKTIARSTSKMDGLPQIVSCTSLNSAQGDRREWSTTDLVDIIKNITKHLPIERFEHDNSVADYELTLPAPAMHYPSPDV